MVEDIARAAVGALPEAQIVELMNHIPSCERCSILLEIASQPELDDAKGAAHPAWITPVAAQMARQAASQSPVLVIRNYQWWAVAAALLMLAAGLAWYRAASAGTPLHLLAQAYTESRPFEFRLPDNGYRRVLQQRSGESTFDKPAALLQAVQQIQQALQKAPDSAQLLQAKGRAELLEREPERAIETLQHAQNADPQNHAILSDLACAYALRGEAEQSPMDYGRSVELLLQSLKFRSAQPEVVFNLALVYAHLSLLEEAVAVWDDFLNMDSTSQWADEARKKRGDLLEQIRARQANRARITPNARDFLAITQSQKTTIRAELYYDIAWRDWLPRASTDPDAMSALRTLAQMFLEHHLDRSLQDATESAAASAEGLKILSEAIGRDLTGSADEAYKLAAKAKSMLASNRAADFRARLEQTYVTQRSSADSCLADAKPLADELQKTAYIWMRAQATLQEAICWTRSGDTAQAHSLNLRAQEDFDRAGFDIQSLRAMGAEESLAKVSGNVVETWNTAAKGLERSWALDAPPARIQQFTFDMADSAKALGWTQSAPVLGTAAVREVMGTGNKLIEAIDRVYLAALWKASGRPDTATQELKTAEAAFTRMSQTTQVTNLKNDARLQILEMNLLPSNQQQNDLQTLEAAWPEASWQNRLRMKRVLGRLLKEDGKDREAEAVLLTAARMRETTLAGNGTPALVASADAVSDIYADLAGIQMTSKNDPRAALDMWERERRRPYGRVDSAHSPIPSDTAALIYAVLPDGIAAWVVRGTLVRGILLPVDPSRLEQLAGKFQRECSYPSSIVSLRADARELYELLVQPFAAEMQGSRVVTIDADKWIAEIPFAALVNKEGKFLIESYAVGIGPRDLAASRPQTIPGMDRAVIVAAASPTVGSNSRYPPLPAVYQEAHNAAAVFRRPVILENAAATPGALKASLRDAEVFHFAGHGWSNGGDGGLILPARDAQSEPYYWTASAVATLNWSHYSLVVLSACMTGTGESHGPFNPRSLVRAFLAGGVVQVIASQWNADSSATATLMNRFYQSLQGGTTPVLALAEADRALLRDPALAHPYYWASFAVFGRP